MDNKAKIYYYDIGDYLSCKDKLQKLNDFGSVSRTPWQEIEPDEHGDWINLRNKLFQRFIPLGSKEDKDALKKPGEQHTFFVPYYSNGMKTQRDAWAYNSSLEKVKETAKSQIDFYNEERLKLQNKEVTDVDYNTSSLKWTREVLKNIKSNEVYHAEDCVYVEAVYRPFFKQSLLYYKPLNGASYRLPYLFPTPSHGNVVICVSGKGSRKPFSCIMSDKIPDTELVEKAQCFPLYWYETSQDTSKTRGMGDLFGTNEVSNYTRHDGVTDWIEREAQKKYGAEVTKEDVFYYVYGFLHSPEYNQVFAINLKKSLSQLPLVDRAEDFQAFAKAGRELAELHLHYEEVEPYEKCKVNKTADDYKVVKMRFGKKDKKTNDKSVIYYNQSITISEIPMEAYEYVVNGRSAIEWVMKCYQVKTTSGITNNPNDWAREHNDPHYILDLLLRVINVSMKTMEIIKHLPDIHEELTKEV